jgi:hypothetical protein
MDDAGNAQFGINRHYDIRDLVMDRTEQTIAQSPHPSGFCSALFDCDPKSLGSSHDSRQILGTAASITLLATTAQKRTKTAPLTQRQNADPFGTAKLVCA